MATKNTPTKINSLSNIVSLSSGDKFSAYVKSDGTLWALGDNTYGQLGDATTVSKSSPIQVGALTTWSSIKAGKTFTQALKTDGTLWTWGKEEDVEIGAAYQGGYYVGSGIIVSPTSQESYGNYYGGCSVYGGYGDWFLPTVTQLGIIYNVLASLPVAAAFSSVGWCRYWASSGSLGPTDGESNVPDAGMDPNHGFYEGYNYGGGNNFYSRSIRLATPGITTKSSPVQIGALTTWTKLSSGKSHSIGVISDGTMWSWGLNSLGQLGDSTTVDKSSPVQVGALNQWLDVYTNNNSTYALKANNTLWTWGDNTNGILGDNSTVSRSSPVQIGALTTWYKIAANNGSILGLTNDWKLYSWGKNANGQLGLNDTIYRSSPVQIGALNTWYDIGTSAANSEFFAAIQQNGTLWTWGRDNYSQTGIGNLTDKSSPVQVGILTTWNKIASGSYHCVAVNDTSSVLTIPGTLWVSGYNAQGQLGDGTTVNKSSPVQIGSYNNYTQFNYSDGSVSHFIKTDGTLWGCGSNSIGIIGDGTTVNKSSPVQIGTSTKWKMVTAGHGIQTDGTLWGWGANDSYIGDNTTVQKSNPVQIGNLTTWKEVRFGYTIAVALKTDGTLWSWGQPSNGYYGNLGDNSITSKSSPIQIGTETNWAKIGPCNYITFHAIKNDGTLWGWGKNTNGAIGDGTTVDKSNPVQIGGLTTWRQIGDTNENGIGLTSDGKLWTWGITNMQVNPASNPTQVGTLTDWKKIYYSYTFCHILKNDGTLWGLGRNTSGELGNNTSTDRQSPVQVGSLTTWKSKWIM